LRLGLTTVLLSLFVTLTLTTGCGDEAFDPLIEAILPDHAPAGEVVEVVGERFAGEVRGVAFGGHPAQVLNWGERRARTRVPDNPGLSGATVVVVTVDGRPSNPVSFVVE
jgi:hypothetical protein